MTLTLVLGGARSGKSAYALALADEGRADGPLTLIATAQALDEEMTERIARHRAERGARWRTVETPLAVAEAIAALQPGDTAVLDCLTLWLSNVMLGGAEVEPAVDALLAAAGATPANLLMVANEVGLGIVPETPLGRRFRDEAGRLNRRTAVLADRVVVLFAGLPLWLKGEAG